MHPTANSILTLVWSLVNSPAGITVLAAIALWLLNRVYSRRPAWLQYEGTIISAVKLAEQQVPDGTPNKGLARLDAALQFVLKVYEQVNRRRASAAVGRASPRATARISRRTSSEYGTVRKPIWRTTKSGPSPEISATTASTPSTDVPDISPTTFSDLRAASS